MKISSIKMPRPLAHLLQKARKMTLRRLWELLGLKILDRYIIGKFIGTYIFLLLIIIAISIVIDINEKLDKISASHAPLKSVVVDYYLNFVPYFTNLFSPLFVFIAVIFFTSKLADGSEIIAMKSTGMSFRRLLRPYMISASLIAVTTLLLGLYIIPRGNVARVNFENTYVKRKKVTTAENIQLQVDKGVVAFLQHFDSETKSGYGFSLDKFKDKKLVSHLTAQQVQYDTLSAHRYHWTLRSVQVRTFNGMREKVEYHESLDSTITMEPADLVNTRNQQETMTSPELRRYISRQRERGAAGLQAFEVEYHKRFAMPFAAFILTLIGVSLSSEKRKGGGMGTSIGVGLALSFSYILFQTVSASFAVNGGWPPMLAAWIPNILFAAIAFVLYRRTPQ